jgi:hypothetical protein
MTIGVTTQAIEDLRQAVIQALSPLLQGDGKVYRVNDGCGNMVVVRGSTHKVTDQGLSISNAQGEETALFRVFASFVVDTDPPK